MAVHLAVAGDVFGGDLFCVFFFFQKMSWMRSGTELSQFLRIFSTYSWWFCRRSRLNLFYTIYGHDGHLHFQILTILAFWYFFHINAKYEIGCLVSQEMSFGF